MAALLMTALDIVVDPLAVRGDRWFLGDIFYYPNGGTYFGVPLSNFTGWFLVALSIIGVYSWLSQPTQARRPVPLPWLGPLFYWGILGFNFMITAYLKEWKLLACGLSLHLAILGAITRIAPTFRGFPCRQNLGPSECLPPSSQDKPDDPTKTGDSSRSPRPNPS